MQLDFILSLEDIAVNLADKQRDTPLHLACRNERTEMLERLLVRGM